MWVQAGCRVPKPVDFIKLRQIASAILDSVRRLHADRSGDDVGFTAYQSRVNLSKNVHNFVTKVDSRKQNRYNPA